MQIDSNEARCPRERGILGTASSGCRLVLALLLLTVASGAVGAAQGGTQPTLAGIWRLHETVGELPEQAARALEGKMDAGVSVTIRIDQTDAAVTVRRLGDSEALLRVMSLAADAIEHQVPGGGVLRGRAEWRDRAVVATGHVAVKQGMLKRNVPFEEVWQLDEAGRTITVTTTLKTPLGVKRRTQVFRRVTEEPPGAGEPASADHHAGR